MLIFVFESIFTNNGDRKEEHHVDRCYKEEDHVDRCSFFHVDQTTVTTRTNTSSIDDIFSASIFTDGDRKEEHHVDLRVDLYKQR